MPQVEDAHGIPPHHRDRHGSCRRWRMHMAPHPITETDTGHAAGGGCTWHPIPSQRQTRVMVQVEDAYGIPPHHRDGHGSWYRWRMHMASHPITETDTGHATGGGCTWHHTPSQRRTRVMPQVDDAHGIPSHHRDRHGSCRRWRMHMAPHPITETDTGHAAGGGCTWHPIPSQRQTRVMPQVEDAHGTPPHHRDGHGSCRRWMMHMASHPITETDTGHAAGGGCTWHPTPSQRRTRVMPQVEDAHGIPPHHRDGHGSCRRWRMHMASHPITETDTGHATGGGCTWHPTPSQRRTRVMPQVEDAHGIPPHHRDGHGSCHRWRMHMASHPITETDTGHATGGGCTWHPTPSQRRTRVMPQVEDAHGIPPHHRDGHGSYHRWRMHMAPHPITETDTGHATGEGYTWHPTPSQRRTRVMPQVEDAHGTPPHHRDGHGSCHRWRMHMASHPITETDTGHTTGGGCTWHPTPSQRRTRVMPQVKDTHGIPPHHRDGHGSCHRWRMHMASHPITETDTGHATGGGCTWHPTPSQRRTRVIPQVEDAHGTPPHHRDGHGSCHR